MNKDIVARLKNNCLRIEGIYHPISMELDERIGDYLESFIEYDLDDVTQCLRSAGHLSEADEISDWLEFIELILELEIYGYLVTYAVPRFYFDGDAAEPESYDWGSYYTKTFYGSDIEETTALAIQWAKQMKAKDLHNSKH